jgi:hypothetical protein
MPIAYRSILRVEPSPTLIKRTGTIVAAWLAEKQIAVPGALGAKLFGDRQLTTIEARGPASVARRWELKEPWDGPRARGVTQVTGDLGVTSVTIVSGTDEAWLWIDINSPRVTRELADGSTVVEAQEAGTPRLVAELIAELAPNDGLAETYTGPLLIATPRQADQLVDALSDTTRVGSVFVSAPPLGQSLEAWAENIKSLTRGTQGLGSSYVVAPAALLALNQRLGLAHAVRPGGLRTYLPGVVPGDRSDAYRHKALAASTLSSFPAGLTRRILRSAQIERLTALRLPALLQRADYDLLRQQRLLPLAEIRALQERAEKSRNSNDVEELWALNLELSQQLDKQKEEALEALAYAVSLMDDVQDLRETIRILEFDLDETWGHQEESDDLIEVLRRRLIRAQAFDDAFAPVPEDERTKYPESFGELMSRLGEFPAIMYVGDASDPEKLDEHPNMAPAIHKAWDALATLNDYARLTVAGEFAGGLKHYLDDPNHQGVRRLLNFKSNEGANVRNNPRMAVQREVSVPASVDPSGVVMTTAHIGLLTHRAKSPRLYFEDRVVKNQVVLVGYIGEHLTNVMG